MKAVILLAVVLFASALAMTERDYQNEFTAFMQKYKKSYHHDEFQFRYATFKKNLDFITQHNTEGHSYTVAVNHVADLSNEEYRRIFLGLKLKSPIDPEDLVKEYSPLPEALPAAWNWNDKGACTPIKNQQQCGSCWSFSTTGSSEGCHFISTGKLVSLSEQNIMDCSNGWGNAGCDGGLMTEAMNYIIANKGVDTESSYPYTAEDGTCQFKASNIGATLNGMANVTSGDENDLQTKVYAGPTSVAIDASQSSFQFYSSGVYSDPNCSSTQLDHGVLAVGWGTDGSKPYWIVKNSWGTSWGQQGWFWLARNAKNMCGIATMATRPTC